MSQIPPPPTNIFFQSQRDANQALHEWTKLHGFNVSKVRPSYNDFDEHCGQEYACDRAGAPKNTGKLKDEDRVRDMRGSKRSGCPMRIRTAAVDRKNPGGLWKFVYTTGGSTMHNHSPSDDVRIHAQHRQRYRAMMDGPVSTRLGEFMCYSRSAGIRVSKIHASIHLADPNALTIPKDVSNEISAARLALIHTQTTVEALFEMLKSHEFYYRYALDQFGRLQYLFWTYEPTLRRCADYPDVIVLDCTYKTNGHN